MQKFVDDMVQALSDHYGNLYEFTKTTTKKNNSTMFSGIMINKENSNISPTIYLDDAYVSFMKGESVDKIRNNIILTIDDIYRGKDLNIDTSWLFDFNTVSKKLRCKLINYDMNLDLLNDIPYEKFLDLALVYYIQLGNDHVVLVKNDYLERWGTDIDTIKELAIGNNLEYEPAFTMNLYDKINETFDIDDIFDYGVYHMQMYVITTKSQMYGAITMLYDTPLYNLSEELENNLIILPSSIHEIIVIPYNPDASIDNLKRMVKEVNESSVENVDILSYNVYEYSRNSRQIQIL